MISAWAKEELHSVNLGDERLDDRLVSVLSAMGERPNLSIPAACRGRAEMEAAYRLFDNDKVTFAKVLQPHIDRTIERLGAHDVALLVQDSTEIDLTRPQQEVVGAGSLDGVRRGFLLHEMQAFSPDGTPLGTLWAEVINRVEGVSHAPAEEKEHHRKHTPIEEKESMRWLTGVRQARAATQQVPTTQCVSIADSEADLFEIFAEPRGEAPLHWLIRACQDRALVNNEASKNTVQHAREQVLSADVLYNESLQVRARQAKTAVEERKRRRGRSTRTAEVEVRATSMALRPPWRFDRKLPAVPVNVVLIHEPKPAAGEEPIEWLLLTTLPIGTIEQVRTIVGYYCVRWGIEIFFRTLKSGCRIEQRRFEHVDRLLPFLAVCLMVAWRTQFVCRLGRECPDVGCEVIFTPSEWQAVWTTVKRKKLPEKPPRLSEMVHLIARLGGYVERKKNEPGVQTVWIGLQRTRDLAWAWETFGPGKNSSS